MIDNPWQLEGVMQTCLGPLQARADETQSPGGIIQDPWAEELAGQFPFDKGEIDWPVYQAQIAVRTEIIDEVVRDFLVRNPAGTVANLGAGLDARFFRLDNGRARWFELDYPQVIGLRRRFFKEDDRYRAIPGSVLDFGWMEHIPLERPLLFILEGLANYLEEERVKTLLAAIAQHFSDCEIVMELLGLLNVRLSEKPEYLWGLSADNHPARWPPGFRVLASWSIFERHKERWAQVPELGLLFALRKNVEAIFHLTPTRMGA